MKTYTIRSRWHLLRPTVLVIALLASVAGLLWYLQIPGFLFARGPNRAGLVPVPVSAIAIPAYTKVTRDHLWDTTKQDLSVVWMRPEAIQKEIVRGLDKIIGRVMDHDKMSGYAFTEADFLPPGTRPGLVAGIPAGKRAMRLDAEKLQGLVGLRRGDRFDLISAIAISPGAAAFGGTGIYAQQMQMQANLSNWTKQATVRVLVQNGVVVEPLTTRQVPIANRTLTQGTIVRTKPVQEIVIAVDPVEVARLSEALAVDAEINCVPRSGRPDDPYESRTPGIAPLNPFTGQGGTIYPAAPAPAQTAAATAPSVPSSTPVAPGRYQLTNIETINGGKRDMVAAPMPRR